MTPCGLVSPAGRPGYVMRRIDVNSEPRQRRLADQIDVADDRSREQRRSDLHLADSSLRRAADGSNGVIPTPTAAFAALELGHWSAVFPNDAKFAASFGGSRTLDALRRAVVGPER